MIPLTNIVVFIKCLWICFTIIITIIIILLRSNFCVLEIFACCCLSIEDSIWITRSYSKYDSLLLSSANVLLAGTLATLPNTNSCGVYFVPSWILVLYAFVAYVTYFSQSCFCDYWFRYSISTWWERSIDPFDWGRYAEVLYIDILYLYAIWRITLFIKFGPWFVIHAFCAIYGLINFWLINHECFGYLRIICLNGTATK